MIPFFLTLPILLGGTAPQDAPFPGPEPHYTLTEVNGAPYDKRATLRFPEDGRIAGQGPCNNYFGPLTGTPGDLSLGPLATTQMACPDLEAERLFLDLLSGMTQADVGSDTVRLHDPQGNTMVFAVHNDMPDSAAEDQPGD
ncbi:MAG: META domain-containing protein [Qingshengfaniella sp.]